MVEGVAQVEGSDSARSRDGSFFCTRKESRVQGCGCRSGGTFGNGSLRMFLWLFLLSWGIMELAAEAEIVWGAFEQGCSNTH